MNINSIIKKISNIHNEIYDQRDIIEQEILYLIREFDKNHDLENTEKIITNVGNIINQSLIKIEDFVPKYDLEVAELNNKVDLVNQQCLKLLGREGGGYKEKLNQRRKERANNWEGFVQDMIDKTESTDTDFISNVKKLETYYKESLSSD
ncbi:unnamed protein product [Gordionus sp. m RMFG-2023]